MPDIVSFLIFIFALTIVGIIIIDRPRVKRERAARANSRLNDRVDARLVRSEAYWAGLAAGARFTETYRSPTEVDECWYGMQQDQMFGDQAERDFAYGWMRSVAHLHQVAA